MNQIILFISFFVASNAFAQEPSHKRYDSYPDPKRFYSEISSKLSENPFIKSDKDLIVFTGSSSIRFWGSLTEDFNEYDVLNRGFGGSIFSDLNFYMEELVLKHNPDMVVIYEGDNDVATEIPLEDIFTDFKTSFDKVRSSSEDIPIIYIAPKPSPSRWNLKGQYSIINQRIKKFCDQNEDTYYFDSWSIMLNEKGEIPTKYFWKDMLHMNSSGYEVWTKNLKPLIDKILRK